MGYRVEYGDAGRPGGSGRVFRGAMLALAAGAVVLALAWRLWPQEVRALLPGDPAVTAAALEELAQELRGGQGLRAALTAFCRAVFREAGLVR